MGLKTLPPSTISQKGSSARLCHTLHYKEIITTMGNADNTNYVATFTLSQTGVDGEINAAVSFNPVVDLATVDEEAQPGVFEIMSHLVEQFLFITGVVDENGELLDPEAFHSGVQLNVSNITGGKTLN
jgi:hypothetical protein